MSIGIKNINEYTIKELRDSSLPSVKARASDKKLIVKYIGVDKIGRVHFKCSSETTPNKYWSQIIRFDDLDKAKQLKNKDKKITDKDIINLVIYGDISLYCSDPSFKYYCSYMSWVQSYGIRKETRYPKHRNPYLKGKVCKHCLSVFDVLPFYINTIVKDMRRRKVL